MQLRFATHVTHAPAIPSQQTEARPSTRKNMNIHALPMQPTKTLFLFSDWCYFLFASATSGFSDYGCPTIRLFFTVVFVLGWVCFEGVFCFAKYNPASC